MGFVLVSYAMTNYDSVDGGPLGPYSITKLEYERSSSSLPDELIVGVVKKMLRRSASRNKETTLEDPDEQSFDPALSQNDEGHVTLSSLRSVTKEDKTCIREGLRDAIYAGLVYLQDDKRNTHVIARLRLLLYLSHPEMPGSFTLYGSEVDNSYYLRSALNGSAPDDSVLTSPVAARHPVDQLRVSESRGNLDIIMYISLLTRGNPSIHFSPDVITSIAILEAKIEEDRCLHGSTDRKS